MTHNAQAYATAPKLGKRSHGGFLLLNASGKSVKYLSKSLELLAQPTESSRAQAADNITRWLEKLWYQRILSAGMVDLWLEVTENRTTTPTEGTHHLALSMISLGAFTSSGRYVCHWKSERTASRSDNSTEQNTKQSPLVAGFEYDNDAITVSWKESAEVQWKMEISFDSLAERVVLVKPDPSGNHLYLFIVNQPKIHRGVPQRRQDSSNNDVFWERDVCFGTCDRRVLGASNAIHLEIDDVKNDNIDGLLQRLSRHEFHIYVGSPQTVEANPNTAIQSFKWPQFKTFEATYAWYCLITRGFKVTDQISDDIIDFLQEQEDELLVSRLQYMIGDEFDNNCVVSLSLESLQHEWESVLRYRDIDADNEDQQLEHLVKVRRIVLTPSVLRGLPAEYIVGNRVVREFGVDRFVRVVLRDEDMELLSASGSALTKPVEVITHFLRQDLVISDRRYHFLGCSNSQMREHGFWMYVSDGKHTVDSIRQWMGDLSHERCVATYVSRLGQFFSASKKAITVDKRSKQLIPDIERYNYCFTDGIGKISRSLSRKV